MTTRVPIGCSTVTVGTPPELTMTQPIENPSLEILFLFAVRVSSQRT